MVQNPLTFNLKKEPSILPDYIDINATVSLIGIDPRYLKPTSERLVVTDCVACHKVRHVPFRRHSHRHCLDCHNAMIAQDPANRAARSAQMKQHYRDGGKHPTKGIGHSPEACAKISAGHKGIKEILSPETLAKKREQAMRVLNSPEVVAKTRAINMARVGPLSHSYGRKPSHTHKTWHVKPDGSKVCFRSTWEDMFAKDLNSRNVTWDYESKSFPVTYQLNGQTKQGTYTPDFETSEGWYEVKGRWLVEARAKYDAFLIQYPHEKITAIERPWFKERGLV